LNDIISDGKPSSTIICISGKKFNINNKQFDVSDFNECASVITGSVINNNRACGSDGTSMNIGFKHDRGFTSLIDVCYSKKRAAAIYTSHRINGQTIKNAMKVSSRPSGFKTSEIPTKISPASSFTKVKQLERFKQLVGDEKAEEYLNKTYLARGHLVPDGDMIFASHQFSTYFYLNVVPQFQSVKNY
jgi:DNA/RNA endonuclease G (NUC1)